jgi:hypothetical protein
MQTETVTIEDPPRMNLLGLILASVLERNLRDEAKRRRCEKLAGNVVVTAGEMTITLKFEGGGVSVARGASEPARAQVRGSLDALMDLSLGGGMVGPWLAGRLKTRGSLLMLLKMRPLIQA